MHAAAACPIGLSPVL